MTPRGAGSTPDVARYYDRNTRRFLRFGGAGSSLAIHRQLWGVGVATPREAAEHINELVGDAIERMGRTTPRVLDLGCGVGGTVLALAKRFPGAELHGVTNSTAQLALAERHGRIHGARTRFLNADFERADLGVTADVVVAVEAFAHSLQAPAFFANAARHLAPDGMLIVVDDFLAAAVSELPRAARREAARFRRGWRLSSLDTVDAALETARGAGLVCVGQRDLTDLIRLDQSSRRVIAAASPLLAHLGLGRSALFGNLIGGGALLRGLASGAFRHAWLRFEHAQDAAPSSPWEFYHPGC